MTTASGSMSSMGSMTTSSSASMNTSVSSSHGMDMGGMGGENACKISMLWNWYTIDACFLSSTWHVRSAGAFAASCIGIALLVVSLEFLRRVGKEYDAFLARQHRRHIATKQASLTDLVKEQIQTKNDGRQTQCCQPTAAMLVAEPGVRRDAVAVFRATPLQQLIRAIIHAVTFGVAYIIMLLAMYYNGYVIISIIIGAGMGKFFFDWLVVKVPIARNNAVSMTEGEGGNVEDPTVCCG